jgi:hypothetical protein
MYRRTATTTIPIIQLLLTILANVNAFSLTTRFALVGRWAVQQQQLPSLPSYLQMSAKEESITAEEINNRLEKQLQKLREKDASSKAISKEVNIIVIF